MKWMLALGASLLAYQTSAQDKYICNYDDIERSIEVVYSEENSKVPCAVIYIKPERAEVAWQARNEEGYCERKAQGLAERLTGFGWQCDKQASEPRHSF